MLSMILTFSKCNFTNGLCSPMSPVFAGSILPLPSPLKISKIIYI